MDKYEKQLMRLEEKIDQIWRFLQNKKKEVKTDADKQSQMNKQVEEIYNYYKEKINKRSRLIDKAKQKISARLKEYDVSALKKAIDNFSQDGWYMENNAYRGVAWFFHSEERIERFVNLVPKKIALKNYLFFDNQACRFYDNKLKIYSAWLGAWTDWNKAHPQYEKFILKDKNNKILVQGKEAYKQFLESFNEDKPSFK